MRVRDGGISIIGKIIIIVKQIYAKSVFFDDTNKNLCISNRLYDKLI